MLGGNSEQSSRISYFSFTCTPQAQTLEAFGNPTAKGTYLPFYTYPFSRAVRDGVVLDVTKDILHCRDESWAEGVSSRDGEDFFFFF